MNDSMMVVPCMPMHCVKLEYFYGHVGWHRSKGILLPVAKLRDAMALSGRANRTRQFTASCQQDQTIYSVVPTGPDNLQRRANGTFLSPCGGSYPSCYTRFDRVTSLALSDS
uniref:Uncharacterized protein n=1 Tax=Peronospora matthiolae TaxID=2874970 RepID=A0AAV1VNK2_9STRA